MDAAMKELMARIGHASPRAALIYQYATSERDRAIASFFDDVVASTSTAAARAGRRHRPISWAVVRLGGNRQSSKPRPQAF